MTYESGFAMLHAIPPLESLHKCALALRAQKNIKNRITLAREIGPALDTAGLSTSERLIAQQIIATLIDDETEDVRRAIAHCVAQSPHLPPELAEKLALDIADISIPVLKLSPALTERFLEQVIDSGAIDRMKAIAMRQNLSKNLCRRLVAMGKKGPVLTLLGNPSARITDYTLTTIIRVYGDDGQVEQAVFDRGALPDDVIIAIRSLTENHVRTFIERHLHMTTPVPSPSSSHTNNDWWDTKSGAV